MLFLTSYTDLPNCNVVLYCTVLVLLKENFQFVQTFMDN